MAKAPKTGLTKKHWFGTLPNCWRPMEQKDYDLSSQTVSYLCNFVRTGDPNEAAGE